MSRRSEIPQKPNTGDFNLSLFENALKDPASKNLILQLLSANQKNVFELFKPTAGQLSSPVKRVKRKEHCESPTALLRRRELEKINRPESAQSDTSEQSTKTSTSGRSSTLPFERILKNVVAYVEINSNGQDRSGGAKALLKSMGAVVSEKFTRDVTHVIFKDGLYTTYQRAKLLKVHLVSVLWLEATRRNGVKAQEKNYPALGTKNYDLNVSFICTQLQKDYEEVIRDEIRKTLESGTPLPSTKTLMENRRKTIASSKSFDTSSQLLASQSFRNNVSNAISKIREDSSSKKSRPSSKILRDDSPAVSTDEDLSRISRKIQSDILESSSESFRPPSLKLGQDEESDSDSECGMINGTFSQKETVVDDTIDGLVLKNSSKVFSSNMDLTCDGDAGSFSVSHVPNRTSNSTASMDLTTPTGGNILKNLKESLMNSVSYLTRRKPNLGESTKGRDSEKENCPTPSQNKTPNTLKLKSIKSKSTVKRKSTVNDSFSTPPANGGNDSLEDDFYRLKTPKFKVPRGKLPKPVNLLARESNKEDIPGISDSSKTKSENNRHSHDRTSSESHKKSTSTSMSSLRLSKSSLENSSFSNDPPLENSSEKQNVAEMSMDLEVDAESKNEEKDFLNDTTQNEPVVSTPFVTERKKRNNRKSVKTDLIDVSVSSQTPNTRVSRRESAVLNKEMKKFKEELERNKETHDKNKEVELAARQVTTPRPARKFASKTPSKSDVFSSPFVNTRPRRKSTLKAYEDKRTNSPESTADTDAGSTRRSSRISRGRSLNTPRKIEEQGTSSDMYDKRSTEEEFESQPINQEKELADIVEEDETSTVDNSANKSEKPVVLLHDVLVSPPKDEKSSRKTVKTNENAECSPPKRIKLEETSKETNTSSGKKTSDSTGTKTVKEDVEMPETERKKRRTTMRKASQHNKEQDQETTKNETTKRVTENKDKKISRSQSESNIHEATNTRKSRRIRKLYDPDHFDSEENIQESLGVNDQEERETIRQEKVLKVNVSSQNSWLNGNVLMSQKAMEFLANSRTSPEDINTLFKKPESVLEKLGFEKGKKNSKKKSSIMDKSSDEQVDLAEEFVNKKVKSTKKEIEETLRTPGTRKSTRTLTQKSWTTGNKQRRSTLEFAPKPLNLPKARTKLNLDQKPTIVCTKMHKADVQVFNQIVKKLGKFEIEDEVSSRTTHLVVGEQKRTINMLRALSRGCWILKHEWLLSSLEEGKWLPEEKYEATEFSPVVQQCRLRRQAFGPSYHMNIFLDCGMIFVAKSTMPRCSDIRELIALCGGKVTKIPDNAKLVVGAYLEGCDCVDEYWVLDSITSGTLKPLEDYAIASGTGNSKSPYV